MALGPILRAMARNTLGVGLIAVQIAFTLTVIINAIFIINERSRLMARPSGLDEDNLFYLNSIGFGEGYNERVVIEQDLARLRQLPGVVEATVVNAIPLSGSGSSTGVSRQPGLDQPMSPAAVYQVDASAVAAMGLEVVAGRDLTPEEMAYRDPLDPRESEGALISAALARDVFDLSPQEAVGQIMYVVGEVPVRVTGVVARLQAPWPEFDDVENAMMVPEITLDGTTIYLIRTAPGERDRLMAEVEELLASSGDERIVRNLRSLTETREESYRVDSVMANVLLVVVGILVFITAMGIVGLAVFSINRRRRQIGTRRALGATQGDILRHFMAENLMISGLGVALGGVLSVSFNILLVQVFNLPRMDWYYTPLGMLALVLVGQLAVLGPSRRAAAISPAEATRTV